MTINFVHGNFLESNISCIVHGCNAQGVMGSGVALQIREKFPDAHREYLQFLEREPEPLGKICITEINRGTNKKIIINAITQQFYGRDKKRYVSYDALDTCFAAIDEYAGQKYIKDIAMPYIGCGLGGGKLGILMAIIDEHSVHYTPHLYSL